MESNVGPRPQIIAERIEASEKAAKKIKRPTETRKTGGLKVPANFVENLR